MSTSVTVGHEHRGAAWEHLTVRTVALALLVQGAAAIAWIGYRYAPVRVE